MVDSGRTSQGDIASSLRSQLVSFSIKYKSCCKDFQYVTPATSVAIRELVYGLRTMSHGFCRLQPVSAVGMVGDGGRARAGWCCMSCHVMS